MSKKLETLIEEGFSDTVIIIKTKNLIDLVQGKELVFATEPELEQKPKERPWIEIPLYDGEDVPNSPISFMDDEGFPFHPCQRGQERLYTQKQTAMMLRTSPITLYRWHKAGILPRYTIEGTDKIYYRESDILSRIRFIKPSEKEEEYEENPESQ